MIGKKQLAIKLPCFGIDITLIGSEDNFGWDRGSIKSDLKEVCPYCNNPQCDMDCPQFLEHVSDRDTGIQKEKEQEVIEFQKHRAIADTIESLVLAHTIAGVDIESLAYIEGLETTCTAIINNL